MFILLLFSAYYHSFVLLAEWRSFTNPFFTEHQTSPTANLMTILSKPCRGQAASPFFPGVQADRWLAVLVRYKRQCWPFQSGADHFSLLQLCSSYFFLPFGAYSCLIPAPSFCLQLLKTCSCLPALAWLFLITFILAPVWTKDLGSHPLDMVPPAGRPWLAEALLQSMVLLMSWSSSCHGPSVCYRPDAFSTCESETKVACLISGPTAPFILVFSPGYNHELNSPGKQYLQYPLHPNYREQQAEIPACISVRAETPYHVY